MAASQRMIALAGLALLAGSALADDDAPAPLKLLPGQIGAVVLDTTGTTCEGVILRADFQKIQLRDAKRKMHILYLNNFIRFDLRFHDDDAKAMADLDEAARAMQVAGMLLAKRWDALAEMQLLPLAEDETQRPKIAELYKEKKRALPESLGGPASTRTARPPRRFLLPRPEQIAANQQAADALAKQMAAIAPATHLVETPHFRIYSAWARSDDKHLMGIYEKLYRELTRQFDMPPGDHVWCGKLPVYAFWNKPDYDRFTAGAMASPHMTAAAGYAGFRGSFDYVVLGPVSRPGMNKSNAQRWFFELLTHESTHAFLRRYISNRRIPSWLNEGIAETIASALVPGSHASYKLKKAHGHFRRAGIPDDFIQNMYKAQNIPLQSEYYGAAQSITRLLIAKGKTDFIELVRQIKAGKADEQALQDVYKVDFMELTKSWAGKIR